MTDPGNAAQIRIIADQVADAAIVRFAQAHPAPPSTPESIIPAPLKWAAAIVAALFTSGIAAMAFWIVSTLSDLQQTVTRIDERQKTVDPALNRRFDDVERRVGALEAYRNGDMK